jgi:hypothetical protein
MNTPKVERIAIDAIAALAEMALNGANGFARI